MSWPTPRQEFEAILKAGAIAVVAAVVFLFFYFRL
jgi:hypothetical protein